MANIILTILINNPGGFGLPQTNKTMKSKGVYFLLWFFGLFGILGLHHFYLGKVMKGLLWLITLGFLGLGSLIDLFTIGNAVDNYNTKKELKELRTVSLANAVK